VTASGDTAWAGNAWPWLAEDVIHVIPSAVDPSRGGVIRVDSSIGERHLAPPTGVDGAKHFAWTTIASVRGLLAAVSLARAAGRGSDTPYLATQSAALAAAFRAQFLDANGLVLGNLEEPAETALDAAAVEAACAGLIAPEGREFARLREACDARLVTPLGRGYKRSDDATPDDERESAFIDLRFARAFALAGQRDRAEALLDWITAQSALNHDLVAEFYDPKSAHDAGATPMAGYGAGAYVLALRSDFDQPAHPRVAEGER